MVVFPLAKVADNVHVTFMSDALTSARPTGTAPPIGDGATARVLGVVRALIAFGRHLTAALRLRDPSEDPEPVILHFGVPTIAQIVARVARGLQMALALEARLLRRGDRPFPLGIPMPAAPRTRTGGTPGAARVRKAEDADPDPLPSAEEIAELVRKRPVGEVIVDICLDFGITADHPLWADVRQAIFETDGNYVRLVMDLCKRVGAVFVAAHGSFDLSKPGYWPPAMAVGTGPPA